MASPDAPARNLVFVSYASDDPEVYRRDVVRFLQPILRARGLAFWSDDDIRAGKKWDPEIERALAQCVAAVLLVSPAFLDSDYIQECELPALIRRGVPLLPILVMDCAWEAVRELASLQFVGDPQRDGPLATTTAEGIERERTPAERHGWLARMQRQIEAILPDLSRSFIAPGSAADSIGSSRGQPVGVPPLAPDFVPRHQLVSELREEVLSQQSADDTDVAPNICVVGESGLGKSMLLGALARDPTVQSYFSDGIHWVTVGPAPELVDLQVKLLDRLGAQPPVPPRRPHDGATNLETALRDRRMLLIVDDVHSVAAAEAFRVVGPLGRTVYSAQNDNMLRAMRARAFPARPMTVVEAKQLLSRLTGTPVGSLPAEADRIVGLLGCKPWTVALRGAAIGRGGLPWDEALARVEEDDGKELRQDARAFEAQLEILPPRTLQAFEELAVFPEERPIPRETIKRLWRHGLDIDDVGADALLISLAELKLLDLLGSAAILHSLQRSLLLKRWARPALRHRNLLDAYADRRVAGSWASLPPNEPYMWDQLFHHLEQVDDHPALGAAALDLAWTVRRVHGFGLHAAESDIAVAHRAIPDNAGIAWLAAGLRGFGHLLDGHADIAGVAGTLDARITEQSRLDRESLRSLLPPQRLQPRWEYRDIDPRQVAVLEGHTGHVNAVSWSPDGEMLASAADDSTARLWQIATRSIATTMEHEAPVSQVAWSPDGSRLAAVADELLSVWTRSAGERPRRVACGPGARVAWAPDGERLAAADRNGNLRVVDPSSQPPTVDQGRTLGAGLPAITWVGAEPRVATADPAGAVRIGTTRREARVPGTRAGVHTMTWSPDAAHLAIGYEDGTTRVWDGHAQSVAHTLEGHRAAITAIAWSPDGERLATVSADETARVWQLATATTTQEFDAHQREVLGVAWSPEGTRLATSSADHTIRVWDTQAAGGHDPAAHTGDVRAVDWSPDGRWVASAGTDGTVCLWDAETGDVVGELTAPGAWVWGLSWSPDGKRLAASGNDNSTRIWSAVDRDLVEELPPHEAAVRDVAWSSAGDRIATASYDGTARITDLGASRTTQLRGHDGRVLAVQWSPSADRLASSGDDGAVLLWDPERGRPASAPVAHGAAVRALSWSPDGVRLASACADGTANVINSETGAIEIPLPGHSRQLRGVVWSPDGSRLATADGHTRIWDAGTGNVLAHIRVGLTARTVAWHAGSLAIGYDNHVMTYRVLDPPD